MHLSRILAKDAGFPLCSCFLHGSVSLFPIYPFQLLKYAMTWHAHHLNILWLFVKQVSIMQMMEMSHSSLRGAFLASASTFSKNTLSKQFPFC